MLRTFTVTVITKKSERKINKKKKQSHFQGLMWVSMMHALFSFPTFEWNSLFYAHVCLDVSNTCRKGNEYIRGVSVYSHLSLRLFRSSEILLLQVGVMTTNYIGLLFEQIYISFFLFLVEKKFACLSYKRLKNYLYTGTSLSRFFKRTVW